MTRYVQFKMPLMLLRDEAMVLRVQDVIGASMSADVTFDNAR